MCEKTIDNARENVKEKKENLRRAEIPQKKVALTLLTKNCHRDGWNSKGSLDASYTDI